MLKEAIDKLVSLGEIRIHKVGELEYSKGILYRVKTPEQAFPELQKFQTLTGLVEYIDQVDQVKDDVFVRVASPTKVDLFGGMDPANDNIQFHFAQATLVQKNFVFNNRHPLEIFIISLLSLFDETEDVKEVFSVLANLENKRVIENTDDGFSQSLQIKTGLTTKTEIKIKNPVSLKPFRTFREIDQPASDFILRYDNDASGKELFASLHEADGGAWELKAIANIKKWLTDKTKNPVIG